MYLVDEQTSPSSRLVSSAARSPDFAITGPDVARNPTPISRATICASVVLPSPGGPKNRTWSSTSPRALAAATNTRRLSRAACCPTKSSSVFGRSAASMSSGRRSGVVRRASSVTGATYVFMKSVKSLQCSTLNRSRTLRLDRIIQDGAHRIFGVLIGFDQMDAHLGFPVGSGGAIPRIS
jgi:hypothetical protein